MSDNKLPRFQEFNRPRRRRVPRGFLLSTILIAVFAAYAYAQDTAAPMRAFLDRVDSYVSMHRRIERTIGPIELNSTPDSVNRFIEQMAAAVRAERHDAKQGDLFSAAVAPEFRRRINDALLDHGFTIDDVRAEALAHGVDPQGARLRVNGTFPWVLSVAMFPCVIDALPALPSELQYRIVGNDLLLIDLHASLIVDILPSALADVDADASRLEGAMP